MPALSAGVKKARTSISGPKKPKLSNPVSADLEGRLRARDGVSESGRYACGNCGRFFCIDCDVFAHEVVHNCPGCQSRERILKDAAEGKGRHEITGTNDLENGQEGEKMDVE